VRQFLVQIIRSREGNA